METAQHTARAPRRIFGRQTLRSEMAFSLTGLPDPRGRGGLSGSLGGGSGGALGSTMIDLETLVKQTAQLPTQSDEDVSLEEVSLLSED